jgi:beta-lactamase family protein
VVEVLTTIPGRVWLHGGTRVGLRDTGGTTGAGRGDTKMGNLRGAVAAGAVAGIMALVLGTLPGTAGAAPLARRGPQSSTGICASYGAHAATAAAISRRILRWAQRRAPETPSVAVRVDDPFLGINCYLHPRRRFDSASVVKTIILATLLNKREREHLSLLSPRERHLARLMITESDNNAATALWDQDRMKNLAYFLRAAGMGDTRLNPAWGLTRITAQDETILLRNILLRPNTVLNTHAQAYELKLMAEVIPSQHWGVSASTPRGFTVCIKNGWAPLPFVSSPWWVNSTGAFTNANPARDYTIVILTHGNADETTGVITIEDIAGPINRALAGAGARFGPAHTKPYPSWNIPDEPVPPVPAR